MKSHGHRIAGFVAALLFVVMAIHSAPLSPTIPELQLSFSEAAFRAILARWGSEGLVRFRWHFAIDFPFLLAYGTWGYLLATRADLFAGLAGRRRLLAWLLPAAAGLDALENLLHLYLIRSDAGVPAILFPLAGSVAAGKWLLIAAFAASGLLALIRRRDGA
jgi:hypothetical protein